jgi:hypothetical protein
MPSEPPDFTASFADVLVQELAAIRLRRERIWRMAVPLVGPPTESENDPRLADPAKDGPERLARVDADQQRVAAALIEARGRTVQETDEANDDLQLTAARRVAMDDYLAGLAFSGGGIRSATFCIGVLQGLAGLGILRFFDYLSTVSGGGYAGGWLAAWIAREGDPLNVERQLNVSRVEQAKAERATSRGADGRPADRLPVRQVLDDEPEPVRHLRQYSSYLNPQPGLFSIDTWTLVAIYARNVVINLMVILPALMALAVAVRLVIRLCQWEHLADVAVIQAMAWLVILVVLVLVVNVYLMWLARLDRDDQAATSWRLWKRLNTWAKETLTLKRPLRPDELPWKLLRPKRVRDWLFSDVQDNEEAGSRRIAAFIPWAMTYAVVLPWLVSALILSIYYVPGLNLLRERFLDDRGQLEPWPATAMILMAILALGFGVGSYFVERGLARLVAVVALAGLASWFVDSMVAMGANSPVLGAVVTAAGLTVTAAVLAWGTSHVRAAAILFVVTAVLSSLLLIGDAGVLPGWLRDRTAEAQAAIARSIENSYYLSLPNVVLHALANGLIGALVAAAFPAGRRRTRGMPAPAAALLAGAGGGVLMTISEELLRSTATGGSPWVLATIGPPLVLLTVLGGLALFVALLGPAIGENEREWWGRLAAKIAVTAAFWTVGVGIVAFGPALLYAAGSAKSATLGALWAIATAVGVRVGSRAAGVAPGGEGPARPALATRLVLAVTPTLFLVGLLMFVAMAVAYLTDADWNTLPEAPMGREASAWQEFVWYYRSYFQAARQIDPLVLVGWLAGLAAVAFVVSWNVDANLFSLHELYANRLTRTFLGASRPSRDWPRRWGRPGDRSIRTGGPTDVRGQPRAANPFTGFDPADEIDLYQLAIGRFVLELPRDDQPRGLVGPPKLPPEVRYWGPHLILNTALNLIAGDDLAWRDRKAESFALTPLYCGSRSTGYARVTDSTRRRLRLGRSVALSGAAVDPNMNQMQSAPMTVLLTIFNARLGAWVENPNRRWWEKAQPDDGPTGEVWQARGASASYLLFRELLGDTQGRGQYVHLSDGGHFENLGVYELIRRRCRFIVAVDATENPNATSDNLGILVRLCRIDFGVRIELDTAKLAVTAADGRSKAHVVIGTIHYEDVDGGAVPGMLVYLRASMTGDEPPDVQQYRNLHPEFPRQLTLTDQSFDEDQFESYRALGHHVARVAFVDAARELYEEDSTPPDPADPTRLRDTVARWWRDQDGGAQAFRDGHRRLFGVMRNRWAEPPPGSVQEYLESGRAWAALQRDLRTDPNLARLSRELYPERPAADRPDDERVERAELHAVEQILQLMADTWVGQGLDAYRDAELGRGWMNTFRRLSGTQAFRRHWPALRAEFNAEFVRYCERQLHLGVNPARLVPVTATSPALAVLGAEFSGEWPEHLREEARRLQVPGFDLPSLATVGHRYLKHLVGPEAVTLPADGSLPAVRAAWLIVQTPAGHRPENDADLAYVRGLAVVHAGRRGGDDRELFAWVRPTHRSMGIGEDVWDSPERERLFHALRASGGKLVVRYPRTVGGPRVSLGRSQWLNFFTQYGFAPPQGADLIEGEEWELELTPPPAAEEG